MRLTLGTYYVTPMGIKHKWTDVGGSD